jgi:GGDEF domain-containing protein
MSRISYGHSFGDHLISESVSVMPSSVREASIVLCSVSL